MPDKQIHPGGVESAPADYVIPSAAEIGLKMAFARFDGSAAVGSWKPCLRVISDAGTVAGEATGDDTVAAGASADVTWFPRVGGAAQGTAVDTGVQWFFGSRVSNQSIPSANLNRIGWTHHVTSDATVFSVTTGATANDTVHGLKAGVYLAFGDVLWAAPQAYMHYCQIVTDFFDISAAAASPDSDSNTDQTEANRSRHVHDAMICLTQAVPGEISLLAGNNDGVAHNVVRATYAIAYLPNSTLVS